MVKYEYLSILKIKQNGVHTIIMITSRCQIGFCCNLVIQASDLTLYAVIPRTPNNIKINKH